MDGGFRWSHLGVKAGQVSLAYPLQLLGIAKLNLRIRKSTNREYRSLSDMDVWFQMVLSSTKCWPSISALPLQLLRNGPKSKNLTLKSTRNDAHTDVQDYAHAGGNSMSTPVLRKGALKTLLELNRHCRQNSETVKYMWFTVSETLTPMTGNT